MSDQQRAGDLLACATAERCGDVDKRRRCCLPPGKEQMVNAAGSVEWIDAWVLFFFFFFSSLHPSSPGRKDIGYRRLTVSLCLCSFLFLFFFFSLFLPQCLFYYISQCLSRLLVFSAVAVFHSFRLCRISFTMDQFTQNQDPASQQVAPPPPAGMATASPSTSTPNAPASVGSSSSTSAPAFQPDENSKTLYVGNLDQSVNEAALQEIFSQTGGQVESVKIIRDKNFAHQGGLNYGFVEYSSHEEAEMALQSLNGRRIYAHEIKVNWAFTGQVTGKEDTASHYHIFIGDISPEINDEALSKAFGVFGTMTDARVMWDANSGKSRGYGFAAFKERADAERAIISMTGQVLGNRPIRCNWASQRGMPGPAFNHQGMHHGNSFKMVVGQAPPFNTTVYVGNLPPQTTQEDLMPFFQPFGFVVDMRLQADRGFAFVKMESHEKAANAIVRLAGTMINGRAAKFSWGKDRTAENAARNNHYGYYNNGAGYPMGGPQNNGAYPYSYNNNNNSNHHHHHHQNNGNNGHHHHHHHHNNNHNSNNGGLQNHYGGGNGQGYGRAGPPHHHHHQQQQQHHVPPPQHLHQQPQMNKA